MTNKEAIKYLIKPFATSTKSYNEYLKQKEAYELAIEALRKKDLRERMKKLYYQELRKEEDNNGTGRGD